MDTAPTIKIAPNNSAFHILAADIFMGAINRVAAQDGPIRVVLPTGSTPLGLYRELIANHVHRRDLWDRVHYVALDDYAGLPPDDRRLFSNWLDRDILGPLSIPSSHRTIFNSAAPDPSAECARMDALLDQGGIDIAVLGLGTNGHIGFNEPGSAFDAHTRLIHLSVDSLEANAAYWGGMDHVPHTAYTLGLGHIMQARETILLVQGTHKADILQRMLHDPVSPALPATALRRMRNVTIIADRAAMSAAEPFPRT